MKFIRTILFVLLALILFTSAAVFIFFQSFNYTKYLSDFEAKASQYLGRPVSIGGAGLGVSVQGITIDVGPLVVADDPNFTTEPFVEINRIRISLDLNDLLVRHKINIKSILLDSPEIHFIRSSQEVFNFQSLAKNIHQDVADSLKMNDRKMDQTNVAGVIDDVNKKAANIFNIQPQIIVIRDASISYIDQNDSLPLVLWINDINGKIKNFSLSKPFPVYCQASLYSNNSNVHAQAMLSLNIPDRRVTLSDLIFNADLSHLEISNLEDISDEISESPFLKSNAGLVQLDLPQLQFSPVDGIETQGKLDINNAVIKDFNVVKLALSDALHSFGGLSLNVDKFFGNQASLSAPDTIIPKASVEFLLHQQEISVTDALIQTNIFEFKAQGSIEKGNKMDLQTVLHLNSDISSSLVNQFQGLKILCDNSQRITIDASLKGVIPHLKYEPTKEFRKKSKKALIRESFNILGSFLGGGFLK